MVDGLPKLSRLFLRVGGHLSRVGSGQDDGDPTRPVRFEDVLIRHDLTREVSNISCPDPTQPASF